MQFTSSCGWRALAPTAFDGGPRNTPSTNVEWCRLPHALKQLLSQLITEKRPLHTWDCPDAFPPFPGRSTKVNRLTKAQRRMIVRAIDASACSYWQFL